MSNENRKPWWKNPTWWLVIVALVGIVVTIILRPWAPPGFTIFANPMQGVVPQGNNVIQTTITVEGIHRYKHPVSLSASGQLSDKVTFVPPSGKAIPTYVSIMTMTVDSNVPIGDYTVIIQGMGADGKEQTCKYILTVKPGAVPPTPTSPPSVTLTPIPPPTVIVDVNPAAFVIQGEEFLLDTRYNAIPSLPIKDGVDLSSYDLEFTFQGGDGRRVQFWYKDSGLRNVYSFPYIIKSGQPIRYNPFTDGRNVDEFNDFTHIYAIGAKVFDGVEGIQITSVKLIKRG